MMKFDFALLNINKLPTVDLHGYDSISTKIKVNEFVNDNIIMKNKVIVFIHGKGSYVVRNTVHDTLKRNKYVEEYKLYIYNDGITIARLID